MLEAERAASLKHSEDLELLRKQLNLWISKGEAGEAGEVEQQLKYYKVFQTPIQTEFSLFSFFFTCVGNYELFCL